MLDYNQIKPRVYFVLDGEPYECLESQVAKKNRGKPSNQTKIKSLISGKVLEKTFHASDKVPEAEIENREIKYLYQKRAPQGVLSRNGAHLNEIWFCLPDNPRERFMLDEHIIGDRLRYIKENDVIKGIYFEDEVIDIKIPIKVELKVVDAPEAVKGNTSSGATKRVTFENGLELFVPLFIKEGEVLVVNTEKGEYVERAKSD